MIRATSLVSLVALLGCSKELPSIWVPATPHVVMSMLMSEGGVRVTVPLIGDSVDWLGFTDVEVVADGVPVSPTFVNGSLGYGPPATAGTAWATADGEVYAFTLDAQGYTNRNRVALTLKAPRPLRAVALTGAATSMGIPLIAYGDPGQAAEIMVTNGLTRAQAMPDHTQAGTRTATDVVDLTVLETAEDAKTIIAAGRGTYQLLAAVGVAGLNTAMLPTGTGTFAGEAVQLVFWPAAQGTTDQTLGFFLLTKNPDALLACTTVTPFACQTVAVDAAGAVDFSVILALDGSGRLVLGRSSNVAALYALDLSSLSATLLAELPVDGTLLWARAMSVIALAVPDLSSNDTDRRTQEVPFERAYAVYAPADGSWPLLLAAWELTDPAAPVTAKGSPFPLPPYTNSQQPSNFGQPWGSALQFSLAPASGWETDNPSLTWRP